MTEPPSRPGPPQIVAHRGASHDAHENTIEAFERAWQQGADAIEGDFRMTSDGEIVCFHDPQAKFRDGKTRKISEVPLGDLSDIDTGHTFGTSEKISIPTIAEVFKVMSTDKHIFIEVKCGPEILPRLLSEISASAINNDQVTVISFNKEVISQVKQLFPGLKANWLVKFRRNRLRLSPGTHYIVKTLRHLNADGVGLQASRKLSKAFVSTIRKAGFGVHVWTVDSPSLARKFVQLGVDSITTNKPQFIRSCLIESLKL